MPKTVMRSLDSLSLAHSFALPSEQVNPLQPADQELLERIRAGDREAFERLFRTHYTGLLRFARAQLGEPADAEDVVHDVFLRLWRERTRLGGDRSLRTYLLSAVRNRVIDLVRHRLVERRWVQAEAGRGASGWNIPANCPDTPTLDADAAALAELDDAIRRAVAALPERCRTAFLLCREQELSYAEAAEVMKVSPATVKTQMARALASLRLALEPYLSILLAVSLLR
jgi:RNA polymerase sigma-70 factor, ECF subfamily